LGDAYYHIGKCKGKFVPVLNYAPCHEGVLGEWTYSSTHSLISVLDGGEWSASCPGRFTTSERALGTHWIGDWVGPQSRSGRGGEEKNSQPLPGLIWKFFVLSPV
jgi:hypothetical protein